MKFAWVATVVIWMVASAAMVVACSADASGAPDSTGLVFHTTTDDSDGSLGGTFYRVTVDDMPCIIWKQKAGSDSGARGYGGITCDWRDR